MNKVYTFATAVTVAAVVAFTIGPTAAKAQTNSTTLNNLLTQARTTLTAVMEDIGIGDNEEDITVMESRQDKTDQDGKLLVSKQEQENNQTGTVAGTSTQTNAELQAILDNVQAEVDRLVGQVGLEDPNSQPEANNTADEDGNFATQKQLNDLKELMYKNVDSAVDSVTDSDDNTTYDAGSGMSLSNTTFSTSPGSNGVWNTSGADWYYNGGKIGVGVNNPTHDLHVDGVMRLESKDNGSIIFTNNNEDFSDSRPNSVVIGGQSSGSTGDIGTSVVIGRGSVMEDGGYFNTVLGYGAKDEGGKGVKNVLIGANSKINGASAGDSTVIGQAASTSKSNTVVLGKQAEVSGALSTAIGQGAVVEGKKSGVFGARTSHSNNDSFVYGYDVDNTNPTNHGFGTTSPDSRLSVDGDATVTGTTTLATNGGKTGVGTNNPSYKLELDGGDINIVDPSAADAPEYMYKMGGDHLISHADNGSSLLVGSGAGGVKNYAGSFFNVAVGPKAGQNVSDQRNTYIGWGAGRNHTAQRSLFVGAEAGKNLTSSNGVTILGTEAGESLTSGAGNTLVGKDAFRGAASGGNNVAIGHNAGESITSGSGNVLIGAGAGDISTSMSNKIYIENSSSNNPLIYGEFDNDVVGLNGEVAVGHESPSYQFDVEISSDGDVAGFTDTNGTCTINPTNTSLSCSSDRQLKKDITNLTDNTDILGDLNQLNAVTYRWNEQDNTTDKQYGFVAQDVEKIFPEFVSEGADGYKKLSYSSLIPINTAAINELNKKVDKIDKDTNASFFKDSQQNQSASSSASSTKKAQNKDKQLTDTFLDAVAEAVGGVVEQGKVIFEELTTDTLVVENTVTAEDVKADDKVSAGKRVCVDGTCISKDKFKAIANLDTSVYEKLAEEYGSNDKVMKSRQDKNESKDESQKSKDEEGGESNEESEGGNEENEDGDGSDGSTHDDESADNTDDTSASSTSTGSEGGQTDNGDVAGTSTDDGTDEDESADNTDDNQAGDGGSENPAEGGGGEDIDEADVQQEDDGDTASEAESKEKEGEGSDESDQTENENDTDNESNQNENEDDDNGGEGQSEDGGSNSGS